MANDLSLEDADMGAEPENLPPSESSMGPPSQKNAPKVPIKTKKTGSARLAIKRSKSEQDNSPSGSEYSGYEDNSPAKTKRKSNKDLVALVANLTMELAKCNNKLEVQSASIQQLTAKIEEVTQRLNTIETERVTTKPTIDSAPSEFWSKFPKEASLGIASIIAKEKIDCSKKEKNLIIFGLPELTSTDPSECSSSDSTLVASMFKELKVEIDTKSIKIIRFAKRTTSSANSNPLKIQFESIESKIKVLRAAKCLKDSELFKKVFINQDLTPTELALQTQLRKDRNARNSQLTEMDSNDRKFGLHKFGGQTDLKFYWGIRSGELRRIKILDQ